jgi:hypothetical protein
MPEIPTAVGNVIAIAFELAVAIKIVLDDGIVYVVSDVNTVVVNVGEADALYDISFVDVL